MTAIQDGACTLYTEMQTNIWTSTGTCYTQWAVRGPGNRTLLAQTCRVQFEAHSISQYPVKWHLSLVRTITKQPCTSSHVQTTASLTIIGQLLVSHSICLQDWHIVSVQYMQQRICMINAVHFIGINGWILGHEIQRLTAAVATCMRLQSINSTSKKVRQQIT